MGHVLPGRGVPSGSKVSGILDATLPWQGQAMLGSTQREQAQCLLDFSFEDPDVAYEDEEPPSNAAMRFSRDRLDALSAFIRQRAAQLVGK